MNLRLLDELSGIRRDVFSALQARREVKIALRQVMRAIVATVGREPRSEPLESTVPSLKSREHEKRFRISM